MCGQVHSSALFTSLTQILAQVLCMSARVYVCMYVCLCGVCVCMCVCTYVVCNFLLYAFVSLVVSKLSNLEDDPSVLALGKLDYQQ